MTEAATMSPTPARDIRIALLQTFVLVALAVVIYLPDLRNMWNQALRDLEAAQSFAGPVLMVLLLFLRRRLLAESLTSGSALGLGVIALAIIVYLLSSWPFNHAYPRWISLVIALAGVVLTLCGWRVLWRVGPLFLLLLLTIPIGSRAYARLIIVPETITFDVVHATLGLLPGVWVELTGPDFTWTRGDLEGTFALGEPHRGASLFLAYLMVGVFATFARVRAIWQVLVMGVATAVIAVVCNYVRLTLWGVITIYGDVHATSGMPRLVCAITSVVLAYVLALATLWVMDRIVTPESSPEPSAAAA